MRTRRRRQNFKWGFIVDLGTPRKRKCVQKGRNGRIAEYGGRIPKRVVGTGRNLHGQNS